MNELSIRQHYKVAVLRKEVQLSASPTAHIGVSMSNPKYSGDKLAALVQWAAHRYRDVQVNLHDSIQSQNIMSLSRMNVEEARSEAIKLGDSWIAANAAILAPYENVSLNRHDELLALFPEIDDRLSLLQELYNTDLIFTDLIDHDISLFIQRKQARNSKWTSIESQASFAHSRSYILNELSLMSLLNETQDFVEIYAGSFLNVLKDPKRLQVVGLPEGLKRYPMIEVDFTRDKTRHLENKVA